ncbi:DUF6585 family protein [Actinomadura flavalba]|uniref:DUF6585 family protein n=1 Tax=Actinomadura flavalba TaxID=1120938 RepID=UPI000379947B|nr:DUF6585 family protein [Actinomadura flavalba]
MPPAPSAALGPPDRVFDARPGRRRILALLAVVLVVGLLLALAAWAQFRRGHPGLGTLTALLCAGYLAGAAGYAAKARLRERGRVVVLHPGGLSAAGVQWPWDAIDAVTVAGVRTGARTRWRYTVRASGRTLTFGDELPGVEDLGHAVTVEVTARVVRRARDELERGGTVRFGPFTAGPGGIAKDGTELPWERVRSIDIADGLVTVRARPGDPDLTALAAATPNACALAVLRAPDALRNSPTGDAAIQ